MSVVCSEVLEHIPDHGAAIREMARLAREALMTVPDMSAIPALFPHNVVRWHLLEATHASFEAEVKRITGGRGVHVILDAVGGASIKKGWRCLAPTGKLVVFGASSVMQGPVGMLSSVVQMTPFWPLKVMQENKALIGVNIGTSLSSTSTCSAARTCAPSCRARDSRSSSSGAWGRCSATSIWLDSSLRVSGWTAPGEQPCPQRRHAPGRQVVTEVDAHPARGNRDRRNAGHREASMISWSPGGRRVGRTVRLTAVLRDT